MIYALLSRVVSLTLGTLYPAYASYKAVRTKNVKEYVRWMMYWIVFALFTTAETFSDLLLSFWFPFYYELKICTLIWLLAPATNGSSLLYKKFVHPALMNREQEIDLMIEQAKSRGYDTFMQLGGRGISYARNLLMEGLVRAPVVIAELVQTNTIAIETRRFEDVTDRSVTATVTTSATMDIDQSDNEIPGPSGTTESDFNLESEGEEQRGKEKKGTKKDDGKGKKKGRKPRKESLDLTFSSGDEMGEDPDFKVPEKKTTRKSTRKPRS